MHIFGEVWFMLSLFKIARFMFPKMSSHDRFLVPDVFKAESVALLANGRDTASISQPCLLKFASQREHLRVNGSGTSTKGGPRHTQQFLTTPHHSGRHQKSAEQGEFSWAQLNWLLAQGDLSKKEMNF
jgi:hypothetical protein